MHSLPSWPRNQAPKSIAFAIATYTLLFTLTAPTVSAEIRVPANLEIADSSVLFEITEKGGLHPREKLVVIFIPGILGSQLQTGDSIIWGKNGRPVALDLALFPHSSKANAELLDAYPLGVTRQDVHGEFENEISALLGGQIPLREFAYDWRQDIKSSAEALDLRIRRDWRDELQGKKVIIIAHSMGGLVAWTWKNDFLRSNDYNFDIAYMILLGSPLKGSCEIMRMLLTGYRPYLGAGALEEELYRYLFEELRPAALTFPSIYQLLPPTSEDLDSLNSCLCVETKSGINGMDHFSGETWKNYILPLLDTQYRLTVPFLGVQLFPKGPPIWTILKLTSDEFEKNLSHLLVVGKEFRDRFDYSEEPLQGRVIYAFSNQHDTTSRVTIRTRRERVYLAGGGRGDWRRGDGRVLTQSANLAQSSTGPPPIVTLRNSHGELIKDNAFLDYVKFLIEGEAKKIAGIWIKSNEVMRRSFLDRGKVVPVPFRAAEVWGPKGIDAGTKALAELNLEVIKTITYPDGHADRFLTDEDMGLLAYQLARHYDESEDEGKAVHLYEIAFASQALAGTVNYVYGLNRYAFALIELGRQQDSWGPLKVAMDHLDERPFAFTDEFKGTLFNNYGMASEHVGYRSDAIDAYSRAAKLGSIRASTNYNRLSPKDNLR